LHEKGQQAGGGRLAARSRYRYGLVSRHNFREILRTGLHRDSEQFGLPEVRIVFFDRCAENYNIKRTVKPLAILGKDPNAAFFQAMAQRMDSEEVKKPV
jgi:hypothetical protein